MIMQSKSRQGTKGVKLLVRNCEFIKDSKKNGAFQIQHETNNANSCILCHSNYNVYCIKKWHNYDILYCSNCQLQFSSPMQDPGRMFYEECAIYESLSEYIQPSLPTDDWRYKTCFKFLASKPNQSLLDIGCGDGAFLAIAQNKGFTVFGIDVNTKSIIIAKNFRGLKNVVYGGWADLLKIEGWKSFDVITLFDVLEHVSSPVSLANTIFSLLSPSGTVSISVPRLDRYPPIFDQDADFPPHHFTLWTSKALNNLLTNAGFEKIRIIEKPLLATDLLLHVTWRAKRCFRQIRKNKGHLGKEKEISLKTSLQGVLLRLMERELLFGKGHTLLAIAKKPWMSFKNI